LEFLSDKYRIKGFIITSDKEHDRTENVSFLRHQVPGIEIMRAIYPGDIHVPFLEKLIVQSRKRSGTALNRGEIGVLLTNRKIWKEICIRSSDPHENYLILESDSRIANLSVLENFFSESASYDIFFWGAWSGNMQLHRSTIQKKVNGYLIGEPYIKTVYGAYGYSLNKKAAQLLLKRTGKISYAVDQYKRFFKRNELRIGGVTPEIISHWDASSTIGHEGVILWKRRIMLKILFIKNWLVCRFT